MHPEWTTPALYYAFVKSDCGNESNANFDGILMIIFGEDRRSTNRNRAFCIFRWRAGGYLWTDLHVHFVKRWYNLFFSMHQSVADAIY